MNELLANIDIERIILHKIHERQSKDILVEPTYNEGLTILDEEATYTFTERVIEALGSNSNSIEMSIYNREDGSTFKYIEEGIESTDEEFIEVSKQIAMNLARSQTTLRIPGGVFIMFDGTIGINENRFIAIIKAETQDGFMVRNEDDDSLVLGHLNELLLTPQQKLYKIGIFIKENNDFRAIIYDKNLSGARNSEAARYFYDTFLGCTQDANSAVLTKRFYKETQNFISKCDKISQEKKIELWTALKTYIDTNQENIISCNNFAETYFEDEYKDDYSNYMVENRMPLTAVIKDTSKIEKVIKNTKLFFNKDIKLTGPANEFDDSVTISFDGQNTVITIRGQIIGQE